MASPFPWHPVKEPTYKIILSPAAKKQLYHIAGEGALTKIAVVIVQLSYAPHMYGSIKLSGRHGALYRIRSDKHRILYKINEGAKEIIIASIKPRKEAYRKLNRISSAKHIKFRGTVYHKAPESVHDPELSAEDNAELNRRLKVSETSKKGLFVALAGEILGSEDTEMPHETELPYWDTIDKIRNSDVFTVIPVDQLPELYEQYNQMVDEIHDHLVTLDLGTTARDNYLLSQQLAVDPQQHNDLMTLPPNEIDQWIDAAIQQEPDTVQMELEMVGEILDPETPVQDLAEIFAALQDVVPDETLQTIFDRYVGPAKQINSIESLMATPWERPKTKW